jgi:hypothetical protein
MSIDEALSVKFEPGQVLRREGRAGMTFDYIEDETVMDRADAVLGLGKTSWEFSPVTDTCVKGTLIVTWPDGTVSSYQDFGYSNRTDSDQPYKEAVSDAIRRLGRFIGIARYLYHKHSSAGSSSTRSGNGRGASPAPRPSAPPRTTTDMPEFPDDFGDAVQGGNLTVVGRGGNDNNECPIHGVTWAGEWGDLWHKTDDPEFKGYCRHPENTRGPAKARR